MKEPIQIVIAAGVTILNLVDGIRAVSTDTVTVVFDPNKSPAQIAEALVAAGRGELVEQIEGEDEEGRRVKFSPVNAMPRIIGDAPAEIELPRDIPKITEDEMKRIEDLKAELKETKNVHQLREMCKVLDLKAPHNATEEILVTLIANNSLESTS